MIKNKIVIIKFVGYFVILLTEFFVTIDIDYFLCVNKVSLGNLYIPPYIFSDNFHKKRCFILNECNCL